MHLARYTECVSLGRHEQGEPFTRVIQPDDSQVEVCRHCGWVRTVVREPDLAAMKRAFVEAWARDTLWRYVDIAGHMNAALLPDAPFIAALRAAYKEGPDA